MVTAEEAAQTLVTLAKTHFPDSALAQYDTWKKAAVPNHTTKTAQMYRDLKNRDIDREFLRPYVDKMASFLRKSKTLEEIMTAVKQGQYFSADSEETGAAIANDGFHEGAAPRFYLDQTRRRPCSRIPLFVPRQICFHVERRQLRSTSWRGRYVRLRQRL